MSILVPQPPPQVQHLIRNSVLQILKESCLPAPYPCHAVEIYFAYAQHLFAFNQQQYLNAEPLDKAVEKGWQLLVADGSQFFAGANAKLDPQVGYVFAGLRAGSYVNGTIEAFSLTIASQYNGPQAPEYEARVISLPWMYVAALWLYAGGEGHDDIFLPIAPVGKGLDTTHFYVGDEFLNALG
jgi:hypothetical protein